MALNGEGVTIKDRDWPVCMFIELNPDVNLGTEIRNFKNDIL